MTENQQEYIKWLNTRIDRLHHAHAVYKLSEKEADEQGIQHAYSSVAAGIWDTRQALIDARDKYIVIHEITEP
jgi:hypothetical protein